MCADGSVDNVKLHELMVKEHFAGMQVLQRGKTYYLTRVSAIRNTAQYSQYTYTLWHNDTTSNVDDNGAVSYRLWCHRWMDWVPVVLNN